jgi:hypothetical protein
MDTASGADADDGLSRGYSMKYTGHRNSDTVKQGD